MLELDGVQSKCVRHMHGVMQRNGFVALHPLEPPPKRSRAASQTHWFWKAGFSPDMDASLDTPPRRPVAKAMWSLCSTTHTGTMTEID